MKIFKNPKLNTVFSLILSFIMGICILACSLLCAVRFTVFNEDFLIETLNNTDYYPNLCSEISENLMDIGDASGLNKTFFEDFVDEVLVRRDVESYIYKFYSGRELKVNTTNFEKALRTALNTYISQNGIKSESLSQKNINYFVKEASDIYASGIALKYFPSIQKSVMKYTTRFNIFIAVTAVVAIAIALFFIFTNEWKHIAVRYIYYAFSSAALFTFIIPAVVFASGIVSKLTILTRSLNYMYTACINSVFTVILVIAVVLIFISAVLVIVHNKLRKNASG